MTQTMSTIVYATSYSLKSLIRDSADINNCNPNPCANGGTCIDGVDSYTCQCAAGYTGPNCNTSKCSNTLVKGRVDTPVNLHTRTRKRTPAHPHTRTPAYPHTRTPAHRHTRTPAHPHTRTPAHPHTHIIQIIQIIQTHSITHTYTRIQTYTHTSTYTHPHMHTYTDMD